MFIRHALGLLAALAVVVAGQDDQNNDPTPTEDSNTPSETSDTSGPATVTIAVGANGHVFTPNEAKANVGDIIKFTFYPAGDNPHRVARAAFGWPCIPYEYANINKPGFYTGIFAPQVISNDPPSYSVRVNDTEPIFFYCAAPGSCVNYHMIGVINPNATQTLAEQLEYAKNATYQLMPGEKFPSETPVPTPTPGQGPPTYSGSGEDDGGSGLSAGAIAGIAIGGAAVLILGATLLYLCGRRGGFDKAYRKSMLAPAAAAAAARSGGGGGDGAAGAARPRSPSMVEANYANGPAAIGGGADGLGLGHNPKSPGQATVSTFSGHDVRSSIYAGAGGYPYIGTTPSPPPPGAGTLPPYGFAVVGQPPHGHPAYAGGIYPPPHSSPRAEQNTPFLHEPAPVELPSGEPPVPTKSPSPGYKSSQYP
ncbi:uncharacterized protein P884DRAFT_297008 [Thermothelomyces heterothallicus CBS 202.75]|uniref:uncharacterized protein n=1 Tax=Thermothelomyces heterothallicus CBS 202.75 TaxID=1149848 RepID=UPI003743A392